MLVVNVYAGGDKHILDVQCEVSGGIAKVTHQYYLITHLQALCVGLFSFHSSLQFMHKILLHSKFVLEHPTQLL